MPSLRIAAPVLIGFALTTVCACDPGVGVSGSVRSSAGEPVQNARVELFCPQSRDLNQTVATDATGRFQLVRRLGCMDRDCVIRVASPDATALQTEVMRHCRKTAFLCRNGCNDAVVDVRLSQTRGN
jgi:hypothetical protein